MLDETLEDAALLKRFKLISLVGLGNYARVYKAAPSGATNLQLKNSQKELAIKSINLTRVSDNYRTKFLPRELSILKRIQHVNICRIYEIFQVSDRMFIVMQFCPKGTIADLLQKIGPLSEPVARFLFSQTVDAVVYLHSLDLAHRDIKVENILLDANCVPKLTDFSYSVRLQAINHDQEPRHSNSLPQANQNKQHDKQQQQASTAPKASGSLKFNETFCGTLPYLSPEMIKQIPYDSKKADVWSLGVSLYVMLNDRIPFPIDDIKVTVKKQLSRDYKFKANADCSDKCRELVGLLLEPDFFKRISSTEASRHQWMIGPREKPAI